MKNTLLFRKSNVLLFWSFVILLFLMPGKGFGQIAAWDFAGLTSPASATATTFNANLVTASSANTITRGAGAVASSASNSFRTTGFQNNGIATTNTDYFQVTLTATTGFALSLSTIDARFGGTSTFFASPGVTSQFAYSLNGSTFTLIGSPVQSTSLTMTQINLSGITALQNVAAGTTVTLRYYASGQTTTGGWGFLSAATAGTNGLAIGGTVASTTPTVNLSVSANAATASETSATVVTVTATSTAPVTGSQTVNVAVTGTNITAGDYALSNATITILSGATTGSVTFTVVDDAVVEATETAILTISSPSSGIVLGATTTQNVVITDNDVATTPLVTLSTSANAGTEAGTTAITVTATADAAVTGNQTVALAVTGTNITAGDYSLTNTTITIPGGATTGSVTFTVVDDALIEGAETATLTISSPSAGLTLGATTTQNIAITDNDFPTVALTVSANAATASEASATVVTVTATASQAVVGAQTVALGVSGTGITVGDYTLSNATITIANNATVGTVTFTVVDDALNEGTETAVLTISSPSAGLTLGSPVTQNVVIADNDIPPANDDCAGAIDLGINATSITGTFVSSTPMTGATKKDVFYSFTPAVTGTHIITINTFSAASDKDLYIYTPCPASYPGTTGALGTGGTTTSTSTESVSGTFTAGISYKILVQDFGGGLGTFKIGVTGPLTPCVTPTVGLGNKPSSLSFSGQTTTAINGSFNKATTEPTHYLVVQSTASTLSASPIDGTGYTAGTALGGGTVAAAITATGASSYNFSANGTLASNTVYYFFVIPYNFQAGVCNYAYGDVSTASITSSTTTCPGATGTPTNGVITSSTAIINWTAPSGNGTITSYDLQWRVTAGTFATITGVSSGYSLAVTASQSYEVQVRANNSVCTGAFSASLNFSAAAIDAPIATAATNPTATSFDANWATVPGTDGYRLDVSTNSLFGINTVGTVVGWNFQASSVTASSGIVANSAKVLSTGGGTSAITFTNVSSSITGRAATWDSGSGTKYWEVATISTVGYSSLTISSKQRSSSTGPRDFKLQYKVGAGTYADVPSGKIGRAHV